MRKYGMSSLMEFDKTTENIKKTLRDDLIS